MANPINKAIELRDLLEKILETVNIAANPRKTIEDTILKTKEIILSLEFINENVVPLEIEESLTNSLQLWNQLDAGKTRRGDPKLEDLIVKSETLDALQRSGVEIKSVNKFGEGEFDLAKEFGDNFQSRHWALQKFKLSLQNGRQVIRAKVRDFKDYRAFFEVLRQFDVISTYETELLTDEKEDLWVKIEPYELRKAKPFAPIKVKYSLNKSTFNNLITGDWFNAYTFQIISKHLQNNRFDYELFTRVEYQAPRDIIRSDGDFDIIGKIENHLLFVECKSGKLTGPGNYELDKIVEKTEDLKQVFSAVKTGIDQFTFLMIYNPFLDENKEISDRISDDILAVKPFEIRGTITSLFKQ